MGFIVIFVKLSKTVLLRKWAATPTPFLTLQPNVSLVACISLTAPTRQELVHQIQYQATLLPWLVPSYLIGIQNK